MPSQQCEMQPKDPALSGEAKCSGSPAPKCQLCLHPEISPPAPRYCQIPRRDAEETMFGVQSKPPSGISGSLGQTFPFQPENGKAKTPQAERWPRVCSALPSSRGLQLAVGHSPSSTSSTQRNSAERLSLL